MEPSHGVAVPWLSASLNVDVEGCELLSGDQGVGCE